MRLALNNQCLRYCRIWTPKQSLPTQSYCAVWLYGSNIISFWAYIFEHRISNLYLLFFWILSTLPTAPWHGPLLYLLYTCTQSLSTHNTKKHSSLRKCLNRTPFTLYIEYLWHMLTRPHVVNPRWACTARVTVVGSVCLCVHQHLTSRASFRPETHITYSTGNEGKKICGVFFKTASLQRSSTPSVIRPYEQAACTCVISMRIPAHTRRGFAFSFPQ